MVDLESLNNPGILEGYGAMVYVIILLIGLVFAFWGAKLVKAIAGLIGAIVGSSFAYLLAMYFRDQLPSPDACALIAAIIGALIGAYLAMALMKMFICGFFGLIGFFIGLAFTNNFIVAIILAIILAVIVSMVINQFLAIITAILGGLLVGYLVLAILDHPVEFLIFLVIAGAVAFMGARYQIRNIR